MTLYTYVADPDGTFETVVTAMSGDGLVVAGYYIDGVYGVGGFVEDLETERYTAVSDPNASQGSYEGTTVNAISGDGNTVGGYYTNSSGTSVGFVENVATGVYTDVIDPNGVGEVTAISEYGVTVAGNYINSSDNVTGFLEDVGTGVYKDVSDPNGSVTHVNSISGDGAIVAGYYVTGASDYVGYVYDDFTGDYTDVSDPNAIQANPQGAYVSAIVNAVSPDGETVAGYYSISPNVYAGFVENVETGVYSDVKDPSGVYGTIVTAISADGSTSAGYYINGDGDDVAFVENVAAGSYHDVGDPTWVSDHAVAISDDAVNGGQTVAGDFYTYSGGNEGFVASDIACYGRGSSILTDRGEVAVELLGVGDLVVTASGGRRPIVWIGHRRIDIARHPDPKAVRPFCVSAGAFGEGKPSRDLWLSPGHNIAAEGVLIGICTLENGRSVVQHPVDSVEYWHLELDEHDIILAEGLAAESYLDCGNRTGFANGGAFIEAHPDFRARHAKETCARVVNEGPEVARVKALLLERLDNRGHFVTSEADIHLMVNGERIEPIQLSDTRFAFTLAPGHADIRLMSRVFVPAHTLADSSDTRSLGICVKRLQIDGEDIALDGETLLSSDWHDSEPGHRWARGRVSLPGHTRLVLIDLAGPGHYWSERTTNVVALRGRATLK